jgi:hypothetical protein
MISTRLQVRIAITPSNMWLEQLSIKSTASHASNSSVPYGSLKQTIKILLKYSKKRVLFPCDFNRFRKSESIPYERHSASASCHIWETKFLIHSCCLFELHSGLKRFESSAFSYSSLESIVIPQNIEIHYSKCFSFSMLSSILFESKSGLKRIESSAFSESSFQSIGNAFCIFRQPPLVSNISREQTRRWGENNNKQPSDVTMSHDECDCATFRQQSKMEFGSDFVLLPSLHV